ncbi:MAG: sensor domain-containing diguanylate cyclase [Deltaproteobacteria bacterium]|nr:MAG: sensor domain-containing diguanylate cyclase [Deltaproteobacteria bacterium]
MAARELLRIVQTEKKLAELDGMRNQYRELYNITSRVLELSGFQDVADHLVESLRKFIDGAELAALLTREGKRSVVLTACDAGERFSQWCEKHIGRSFPFSGSLCALAMRENETMHSDDFYKRDRRTRVLFAQGMDPPGVASVMVTAIPHDPDRPGEAMGALVVASSRQGFFSSRVAALMRQKQQLETFANVARLVLVNAMQYEKLERMATTDALTGLLNRRRFFEILDEETAKALRYERPLGLIMCDVDHFKSINDTYGHPMGDEVLKRVARVLGQEARATDRVCRIGGEEFAVVLPETDYTGAAHLAERFRQEIAAQRFTHEGKEFSVTLSLGICVLPEHATHKEQLVQRADLALYQAKHGGRNRVVVYRPDFLQAASGEKA